MTRFHSLKQHVFMFLALAALTGCSPKGRISNFLLDGIPYPLGEVCADYCAGVIAEAKENAAKRQEEGAQETAKTNSTHQPYASKRCDDCHDKGKEEGLILPKKKLCYQCHENFKGTYIHGPVAVGACLECHFPHSSSFPSLLSMSPDKICSKCHQEERVASGLHEKSAKHMLCIDCHDPHGGKAEFFVK